MGVKKELKLTAFVGTEIGIKVRGYGLQQATLLNFDQFGVFVNLVDKASYYIRFYPWTAVLGLEVTREEEETTRSSYEPKPLIYEPEVRP